VNALRHIAQISSAHARRSGLVVPLKTHGVSAPKVLTVRGGQIHSERNHAPQDLKYLREYGIFSTRSKNVAE